MSRFDAPRSIVLRGACCAMGPRQRKRCSVEIGGGRIQRMAPESERGENASREGEVVDLSGFLILPGLVNAHDHLEFSLYPRLAGAQYRNYIEWGEDIHSRFSQMIALHHSVPGEVRVWWGGIRNLLCGVTTVSHHNPLHSAMLDEEFPVRVMRDYGWAHSLALGGDLQLACSATPEGAAFLIHACEGTDEVARNEVWELDRQRLLDESTVLVHGLALDREGVARLMERRTSLILCPSSNEFLFGTLPDLALLGSIPHLSLGSDSPLTAIGDLLDEIRFAIASCGVTPEGAWTMVTDAPARVLRLRNGEGRLQLGGVGDVVAVRDTGRTPAEVLSALTMRDVELVIADGRVQLVSEALRKRLPSRSQIGLDPLLVGGMVRWLRAPVSSLLERAEQVLGVGQVRLGGRPVSAPTQVGSLHAD